MSHQSLAEADEEAEQLEQRIAAAKDAHAREMLLQGRAHLEARRARIRGMEPLREWLEAQEEAVLQALREAQTLFAGMQFSSAAVATAGDTANVAPAWNETAQRLRRQTQAIETAVQEVLSVGQGQSAER